MKEETILKLEQAYQSGIVNAWKKMHHNASISRYYPSLRNEFESRMFFDRLMRHVGHVLVPELKAKCEERFGFALTFYAYGRQGATIAPSEWMSPIGGSGFGRLNWDRIDGRSFYGDDADKEHLEHLRKVMRCMEFINAYWARQAKQVNRWWNAEKRRQGLSAGIRKMDGKRPVMQEVWI